MNIAIMLVNWLQVSEVSAYVLSGVKLVEGRVEHVVRCTAQQSNLSCTSYVGVQGQVDKPKSDTLYFHFTLFVW